MKLIHIHYKMRIVRLVLSERVLTRERAYPKRLVGLGVLL